MAAAGELVRNDRHAALSVGDNVAHPERLPVVRTHDREDAVHFTGRNDDTKANAYVVDVEHLRVADVFPLSDQGDDGTFGWYALDHIADNRMDPCQVEEAIARNVN